MTPNLRRESAVLRDKIVRTMLRTRKAIYRRRTAVATDPAKTVVFILGCQRSGTTMMTRVFEQDFNTKVYPETSRLSSQDAPKRLRLNPLPSVKQVVDQERAPLVILKPLVESQNALTLLDYFEGSKALWLYRHYKDVAASYVAKWGAGHSAKDLRAIVEKRPNNWRTEKLPDSIVQIVTDHYADQMDSHDASALYWFVRNSLYFSLHLDAEPRIKLCKYEDLVTRPAEFMQETYDFLGHPFPGPSIVAKIFETSVAKGRSVELSPAIERLCRELLERLDQRYEHARSTTLKSENGSAR